MGAHGRIFPAGYVWGCGMNEMHWRAALNKALSFIEGFEDDELQEGIPELITGLRQTIVTMDRANDLLVDASCIFDDEEDSVKEEHAEFIEQLDAFLDSPWVRPDTSDIPEQGPEWFERAKLVQYVPIQTGENGEPVYVPPPSRIAITINGGCAELADAENWPAGLELYLIDYDNGEAMEPEECSNLDGRCTVQKYCDDTPVADGMTGHFAKRAAEAWQHD